jgi:hypothetical protein
VCAEDGPDVVGLGSLSRVPDEGTERAQVRRSGHERMRDGASGQHGLHAWCVVRVAVRAYDKGLDVGGERGRRAEGSEGVQTLCA